MPARLFESPSRSTDARSRRGRTLTASIILHGAAVVALVAAQLSAGATTPDTSPGLRVVILRPAPPVVPPPPRPLTSVASVSTPHLASPALVTPIVSPDAIAPSRPAPPASSVRIGSTGRLSDVSASSGVRTEGPWAAAPPRPAAPPVRVHGGIQPPKRLDRTTPEYPPAARAARVEGIVVLEATIDETGRVRNVTVLRSIPLLDRAAVEAVSRWRYEPTRLGGQPVAVVMTVTVRFTLP